MSVVNIHMRKLNKTEHEGDLKRVIIDARKAGQKAAQDYEQWLRIGQLDLQQQE